MKVTIKDIAEKTGLSPSTISRVLTGNSYVNQETRKLVEKAMQELGYRPQKNTKKYLAAKTMLVLVSDITNPFYSEIIRGFEHILEPLGYRVLICSSEDSNEKEEDYLAYANNSGFSGAAMVTARETPTLVKLLDQIDMPIVMVNRYLRSYDCDAVCIDNYRGGYMAIQYLLSMGHTKISHLSGPSHSSASSDRIRGYKDAMQDNGLTVTPNMIYEGNLRKNKGYEYAEYFVKNNLDFTAVFCSNDIMAKAFIEQLLPLGKQVPNDISVISFDETQSDVRKGLKITNISKNPFEMGQDAANTLLARIQNPSSEVRKLIFAPQLNVWDSVKDISVSTDAAKQPKN